MAARLLPKRIRADATKLYAWCRWCDNAVDDAPSPEIANRRLQMLMEDVDAIYCQEPIRLPASQWLAALVERYEIPRDLPEDLLAGMRSDLEFKLIADEDALLLYCYRVAGVVGLMMCRIMGVTDQPALEHAKHLGIAMQMTNIARDVQEDWMRGRCYIPQTWTSADHWPDKSEVSRCVQRLLAAAEDYYEDGKRGYPALPNDSRLAIRIAASIYREIGTEIKLHQFQVLNQRHHVSTAKKLKVIWSEFKADLFERTSNATRDSFARLNLTRIESNFPWTGEPNSGEPLMKSEFHYLAIFGLSMTLIMATALFALMGLNPKLESYDLLPWVYSGVSAVGATVLWVWAQNIGRQLDHSKTE